VQSLQPDFVVIHLPHHAIRPAQSSTHAAHADDYGCRLWRGIYVRRQPQFTALVFRPVKRATRASLVLSRRGGFHKTIAVFNS